MQSSPEANHVKREMVVDELQSAWTEEQTLRETRRLVLDKLAHASSATTRAVAMALAWGMTTAEIADALEVKPSALHEHLPRRFARKRGWHDAPHLGPGWKRYWNGKRYSRTHVPTPHPRQIDHDKVLSSALPKSYSFTRSAALIGLLYAIATLIPDLPGPARTATWTVGALLSLIGLRSTRLYAKLAFVGVFVSFFVAAYVAAQSVFA